MVAVPASNGKKGERAEKWQNVSQGQTGAFVLLFNAQKVHNLENIEPQKEQFMTSNDARGSRARKVSQQLKIKLFMHYFNSLLTFSLSSYFGVHNF